MEEQDYQELQEQLNGATQFIIEAAQEIKNSQAAAESYKAVTDKVIERLSRRPDAVIPEEEYNKIRTVVSSEIKNTVARTRVPAPDMSQVASRIADQICKEISAKIGSEVSRKVSEAIENKTARIEVHHEHYHTNMYGRFASSETNRNMMVWLTSITLLSLGALVLFILRWYKLIPIEWEIFPLIYIGVIVIALLGFMIRLCSKKKY